MPTIISGDSGITFPDATTQSKAVSQATPFAVTASAGAGAELQLPEATANGVNYVGLKAPNALAANTTFTLPTADGTNGQYLQTNGSGQLAFATVASTPVGGIQYFAPSYTPGAAWLPCDGSVLTQASYPALYATIGLLSNGGTVWTTVNSGSTTALWDIAYGISTYVIVGASGVIRTTTSPTLASGTFSTPASGTTNLLRSVAFGNGTFVAVGDSGSITRSTDAVNWTHQTVGTATFTEVIYANGLFVTGDNAAPNVIYTSPDGVTWTPRASGISTSGGVFFAYSGSTFVGVSGAGAITTSSNGTTWSGTSTTALGIQNFSAITYNNGYFVAGTSGGSVGYSTDGINWYPAINPMSAGPSGVASAGGKFIFVAQATSANSAISNGPSAFALQNISTGNFNRIRVVNNLFIAVGQLSVGMRAPVYTYNTATQFVLPSGYAPSMAGQIPYIRVTA